MMDDSDIPETGAVYTFGKCRFADNKPSHFFIKNDPVIDIACGDEHTVVVCQNGRVFSFGSNEYGQLGLGHNSSINKPSCVKALKPDKIVLIACGRSHTLVVSERNQIFAFGNNSDGQLGINDTIDRNVPTLIRNISFDDNENVKQLAAGSNHSCLLTDSGRVFIWGANSEGQLGFQVENYSEKCLLPKQLLFNEKIIHIGCGYYHTAFITENGDVYTFGENENGKLGLDMIESIVSEPQKIILNEKFTHVFCGGNHTFLISVNGEVYGFGSNLNGQLGVNTKTLFLIKPTKIEKSIFNEESITAVSCGERHTGFITENAHLYTCGDTRHGKLCRGEDLNIINKYEPKMISNFNNHIIMNVSCGGCHTIIIAKKINNTSSTEPNTDSVINTASLPPMKHITISSLPSEESTILKNVDEHQSMDKNIITQNGKDFINDINQNGIQNMMTEPHLNNELDNEDQLLETDNMIEDMEKHLNLKELDEEIEYLERQVEEEIKQGRNKIENNILVNNENSEETIKDVTDISMEKSADFFNKENMKNNSFDSNKNDSFVNDTSTSCSESSSINGSISTTRKPNKNVDITSEHTVVEEHFTNDCDNETNNEQEVIIPEIPKQEKREKKVSSFFTSLKRKKSVQIEPKIFGSDIKKINEKEINMEIDNDNIESQVFTNTKGKSKSCSIL